MIGEAQKFLGSKVVFFVLFHQGGIYSGTLSLLFTGARKRSCA